MSMPVFDWSLYTGQVQPHFLKQVKDLENYMLELHQKPARTLFDKGFDHMWDV